MYLVLTNITVQQIPTKTFPDRNLLITIPYICSYCGRSSWTDPVTTMSFVLPKNAKYLAKNASGDVLSLGSLNKPLGGYVYVGDYTGGAPVPVFLRGDVITFNIGWRTRVGKTQTEVTYMTGGSDPTGIYAQNLVAQPAVKGIPNLFQGVINNVTPKLPFTIDCEDMMWLLKYVPTPNKTWPDSMTIQQITTQIIATAYQPNADNSESTLAKYKRLAGISLSVNIPDKKDVNFKILSFITRQGTLYDMLSRIQHQYGQDSYFRGYELRTGLTHYLERDVAKQQFAFQKNILDGSNLSMQRKDDVKMSCVVKSCYVVKNGEAKDGSTKTKHGATEILVYCKDGQFTRDVKQKGKDFEADDVGQRINYFVYDNITDVQALFNIGVRVLKKYYYDGLKGSFTTFGIPYVKHGDMINITNPLLPEMDGQYMVRSVEHHGGAEEGLRQTIELDYKVDGLEDVESYLL